MNIFLQALVGSALGATCFAAIGYLGSRILRRNDVADPLWGLGFIGIGISNLCLSTAFTFRGLFVFSLVILWGLRLSVYLSVRLMGRSTEDVRYANWREEWGKREPLFAFLKVFLLQAVILSVVALPIGLAIRSPEVELGPVDFLGASLFLLGFVVESVADFQLAAFKRTSPGKLCKTGLWSIVRHPNYFGEILIWWGIFFLTVGVPSGYFALISPLVITFLLLKVSGVPMLETVMKKRGDAEFADYARSTPTIWPVDFRRLCRFAILMVTLIVFDFIWLGFVMKSFYLSRSGSSIRVSNGRFDIIPWAAFAVYPAMAFGLMVLAVGARRTKRSALEAAFLGAIFGLTSYGIYDFTSLALIREWSSEMALVDICWGTALCAGASWACASLPEPV